MKKFALLLAAVLMTAISANVFAQGTFINPEVGSVHSYRVAADMDSYLWTVTTTADLGGTNLLSDGTVVSAEATNANVINLTWLNPDVANNQVYYVHVAVTDDGCTNNKVIAVQPVNNFTLQIVNVNNLGADITGSETDYSVCAPEIESIAWRGTETGAAGDVTSSNANSFNYEYGTLEFFYKITVDGINVNTTTWTPDFTIVKDNGANATVGIKYIASETIDGLTDWDTDGTDLAIGNNTPTIDGYDVVWIRVVVENNTGNETSAPLANENLNDNDYTITLNATSQDENTNNPVSLGNTSVVQTQLARPNTGEITN